MANSIMPSIINISDFSLQTSSNPLHQPTTCNSYDITVSLPIPLIADVPSNIESDMECPICLNTIDISDGNGSKFITKYNCTHFCHEVCINEWNRGCPICRALIRPIDRNVSIGLISARHIPIDRNVSTADGNVYTTVDCIEGFDNVIQVPSEYEYLYKQQWKNRECINNNHTIIYRKPYGVIAICTQCLIIQCFNLAHPI